jgi:excinuclease ABC subunit C
VFEDGLARKSEYRRFSVKGHDGSDDISAIREVITRRFRRYLAEREETGELDMLGDPVARGAREWGDDQDPAGGQHPQDTGRRKFAYPPNLVVVDGARGQAQAAAAALADRGIDDIAVCGLAKRLEEVWLPDEEYPLILSRTSEGLYLLQRVRDEAHRFAITYHRQKRGKAQTISELDSVPGLGPARRAALLKHFGSARAVSQASAQEIAAVSGIGPRLAETIISSLRTGMATSSASPTSSGESDAGHGPGDGGDGG